MSRRQREAVRAIEELGGRVQYDDVIDDSGTFAPEKRQAPTCLTSVLGDRSTVRSAKLGDTQITDADLKYLERLPELRVLDLGGGTLLKGPGLRYLEGLTELRELCLSEVPVTDRGLACIRGLTRLRKLDLYYTRITDAGLIQIEGLGQLQSLSLGCNDVTDKGISRLEGLTALQHLDLSSTKVTLAGVKTLQQKLPNCKIQSDLLSHSSER